MTNEPVQPAGQTVQTTDQAPTGQAPTGQAPTGQAPAGTTSPPWNMYVVLAALLLVSVGAIVVLLTYRSVFENATDVTTVLGSWFTVVGTIVGAYFGIKAASDITDKTQGTITSATNTANQALGALNPADASKIVGPPTTQAPFSPPTTQAPSPTQ
jgi:hypothetical protein